MSSRVFMYVKIFCDLVLMCAAYLFWSGFPCTQLLPVYSLLQSHDMILATALCSLRRTCFGVHITVGSSACDVKKFMSNDLWRPWILKLQVLWAMARHTCIENHQPLEQAFSIWRVRISSTHRPLLQRIRMFYPKMEAVVFYDTLIRFTVSQTFLKYAVNC